jgi:hypothetical protein
MLGSASSRVQLEYEISVIDTDLISRIRDKCDRSQKREKVERVYAGGQIGQHPVWAPLAGEGKQKQDDLKGKHGIEPT